MKFKMADGRHIENRILAISPRLIDVVFGMYKKNHAQTHAT